MAAVFLGWNPNRLDRWDYGAAVVQVAETGRFLGRWRVGRRRSIQAGTEAWLLVQGRSDAGTGLIGHGVIMSEPYEAAHSGDDGVTEWYVSVAYDALLPAGDQIRPGILSAAVPGIRWGSALRRPGMNVPASAEPGLRQLWRDLGPAAQDPTRPVAGTYPQYAVCRSEVNRYEQDPDARRVCLAFHGTSCAACGFSFEAVYGAVGAGFINVHHTVPAAMLGNRYRLDPVADLVPLCPNCHAMAHQDVSTPRTVAELRQVISAAGHLSGEVVSDQALEAQEHARRILEGRNG